MKNKQFNRFKSYNKFSDFLRHKKLCLRGDVILNENERRGLGGKEGRQKGPLLAPRVSLPRRRNACFPSLVITISAAPDPKGNRSPAANLRERTVPQGKKGSNSVTWALDDFTPNSSSKLNCCLQTSETMRTAQSAILRSSRVRITTTFQS